MILSEVRLLSRTFRLTEMDDGAHTRSCVTADNRCEHAFRYNAVGVYSFNLLLEEIGALRIVGVDDHHALALATDGTLLIQLDKLA